MLFVDFKWPICIQLLFAYDQLQLMLFSKLSFMLCKVSSVWCVTSAVILPELLNPKTLRTSTNRSLKRVDELSRNLQSSSQVRILFILMC